MSRAQGSLDHRMAWWQGLAAFFAVWALLALLFAVLEALVRLGLFGLTPVEFAKALLDPIWVAAQILLTSAILAAAALGAPGLFKVPAAQWLGLSSCRPAVYGVCTVGIVGLGFLADEVTFLLHRGAPDLFDTAALEQIHGIFEAASPVAYFALTAAAVIGPGIGEELFFRGLVLRSFCASWPGWAAVLGSSFLFGAMHIDPLHSAGAGLIGVYLGFAALRTGSVWPGVVAHGINNLITSLYARSSGGETDEMWSQGHPAWLVLLGAAVLAGSVIQLVRMTSEESG